MTRKWFSYAHATTLRAWFAAHPGARLRLIAVANGFFVESAR